MIKKIKVKYDVTGSIITSLFFLMFTLISYTRVDDGPEFPYFLFYTFLLFQILSVYLYFFELKYEINENFLIKKNFLITSKIDIFKISEIRYKETTKNILFIYKRKIITKNQLEIFYGFNSSILFVPENISDFINELQKINPKINSFITNFDNDYPKLNRKFKINVVLTIIVSICFLFFTISYLNDEKNLLNLNGIINYSENSFYIVHTKYNSYSRKCIDIILLNNNSVIKITDEDSNLWKTILDSNNNTKPIKIRYFFWKKRDSEIYNPSIIYINNKLIKTYTNDIKIKLLVIIYFILILFILIFDLKQKHLLVSNYINSSKL